MVNGDLVGSWELGEILRMRLSPHLPVSQSLSPQLPTPNSEKSIDKN
jgi:hypothetical protein